MYDSNSVKVILLVSVCLQMELLYVWLAETVMLLNPENSLDSRLMKTNYIMTLWILWIGTSFIMVLGFCFHRVFQVLFHKMCDKMWLRFIKISVRCERCWELYFSSGRQKSTYHLWRSNAEGDFLAVLRGVMKGYGNIHIIVYFEMALHSRLWKWLWIDGVNGEPDFSSEKVLPGMNINR